MFKYQSQGQQSRRDAQNRIWLLHLQWLAGDWLSQEDPGSGWQNMRYFQGCGLATLLVLSPQKATFLSSLPEAESQGNLGWELSRTVWPRTCHLTFRAFYLKNELNNTQLSEDTRVEREKQFEGFFHEKKIITEMKQVLYLPCCIQGDGREYLNNFQLYGHNWNAYSVTLSLPWDT